MCSGCLGVTEEGSRRPWSQLLLPPASPPHLCSRHKTQQGREKALTWVTAVLLRCPLTIQDVELVCSLAETWGPRQWSGRGRASARRGDQARDTHHTWGRIRSGLQSVWPP